MISLFSFTNSHPHILKIVLSYCDIGSVLAIDHCRLTCKAVRDIFVGAIYKNLRIPALCDHVYTMPKQGGHRSGQLQWSINRQFDLEGFTLIVPGYKSALFWAVNQGDAELCKLILAKGSNMEWM